MSGLPTLEHATYKYPWEKQSVCGSIPHFLMIALELRWWWLLIEHSLCPRRHLYIPYMLIMTSHANPQTKQLESDTDDNKNDFERTIVSQLQHLFHKNNYLVLLFKTAIELMPTDTQLSAKWQSLWSVNSSYLEIIFFIGGTISWQELLKLIDVAMPYKILSFFGMKSTAITLWDREQSYNTIDLLSYVTDRDNGTRIKTENDSDDDWVWDFDLDKVINAYQILVKKT